MNDTNSLSHTKWNWKYHIVFAPKYRRRVFYGEKRRDRRNTADAVQLEENQDHRGRGVPGSCTYAGGDTAKGFGIQFHGVSEGEEQPDDL